MRWSPRQRVHSASLIAGLVLFSTASICGFTVPIHQEITKTALGNVTGVVGGKKRHFSVDAVAEVSKANADVDFLTKAAFFPDRHFTNDTFQLSSRRLLNLQDEIVTALTLSTPDGSRARSRLGSALHLVQDFYAHSTWVETRHLTINQALGRTEMPDPLLSVPCPDNAEPNPKGGLGSGWVTGATTDPRLLGCGALINATRCYHGNYTIYCVGMNKDCPGDCDPPIYLPFPGSPPSIFHPIAKSLATEATEDYVRQVLDRINGNEKAIAALLDSKGSIGFVIDDTGSMGEEIDGVKFVVTAIVKLVETLPFTNPDSWLLERFGDPDIGSPLITENASVLLGAVNGLFPHGGGDCPELSQSALSRAIGQLPPNSVLFMFTDASAKDSFLNFNVISEAQRKGVDIVPLLSGSCSPIDPAYIREASETGGQLFFLAPSEIRSVTDLLTPRLSGDLRRIFSASGTFSGPAKTFELPVDSTVSRLLVSTSIDAQPRLSLRRPSGTVVTPSDPGIHISHLSSADIVIVDHPEAGQWQISVSGTGNFSVTADGNSPISFNRFDFVEPNQDMHGGYFPIPGLPLLGTSVVGEATILGPFATANFELETEAGVALSGINLSQNFPNADADHFLGSFALPNAPFRVVVRGQDRSGFAFRREFAPIYRGQSVAVAVSSGDTIATFEPGVAQGVRYSVHNLGMSGNFTITVTTSLGGVVSVTPATLTLNQDATAEVVAVVSVPLETPSGADFTITAVAARTDQPEIRNSATIQAVVGVLDTDGDGIPDKNDQCVSSDRSPSVVIDSCDSGVRNMQIANGCNLSDKIRAIAATSKNHGQFVSGVVQLTQTLVKNKTLTITDRQRLDKCAAQAALP